MKVVAFNGSPHKEGNTYQALKMVADELENQGIATEIIQVGGKDIKACAACNKCIKNRDARCVLEGDEVNEWIQKMMEADGIIFGSPVHFSAVGAAMKAFLDRAFYVSSSNGGLFRHKAGTSLVAVRRSGGMAAFDQLNRYILYSEMFMVSANYWNVVHGTIPGDVQQDIEGQQIMRLLGKNMAYLIKVLKNGKGIVDAPEKEKKVFTNFIR